MSKKSFYRSLIKKVDGAKSIELVDGTIIKPFMGYDDKGVWGLIGFTVKTTIDQWLDDMGNGEDNGND